MPELQETSDLPCDTGSAPSVLAAEFPGTVDLSKISADWNSKKGRWSPAPSAIEARARDARRILRALAGTYLQGGGQGDVEMVVVTHGGFLHYLTGDWDGAERFEGTGWANCEVRSYEFAGEEADEEARLRETRESRERRRGAEISLTEDEQRDLRTSREREWRERGVLGGEVKVMD